MYYITYGGLQFSQSTWAANGGVGVASDASREEQIRVAVLASQASVLGMSAGSTSTADPV